MDINRFHENMGVKYLTFSPLDKFKVINSFSTRIGGKSLPPYESLNLGLHTGDDIETVINNRKKFLKALGLQIEDVIAAKQVHSTNVKIVDDSLKGKGSVTWENALDNTDGMVTNSKEVIMMTFYADCVPLYVYDFEKKVGALAHAGWKGTLGMIGKTVLEKMNFRYNSDPSDCIVVIGPSIGPCCYEIDENLLQKFKTASFEVNKLAQRNKPGHYLFNLWNANKDIFVNSGVPENNIFISKLCTSCNNGLFFSYRKENGQTGRMAALMYLKGELDHDETNVG